MIKSHFHEHFFIALCISFISNCSMVDLLDCTTYGCFAPFICIGVHARCHLFDQAAGQAAAAAASTVTHKAKSGRAPSQPSSSLTPPPALARLSARLPTI